MANLSTYNDRSISSCETEVIVGIIAIHFHPPNVIVSVLLPACHIFAFELLLVGWTHPYIVSCFAPLTHIQAQLVEPDDASSTGESESTKSQGTALNDEEAKDLCNWLEVTTTTTILPITLF